MHILFKRASDLKLGGGTFLLFFIPFVNFFMFMYMIFAKAKIDGTDWKGARESFVENYNTKAQLFLEVLMIPFLLYVSIIDIKTLTINIYLAIGVTTILFVYNFFFQNRSHKKILLRFYLSLTICFVMEHFITKAGILIGAGDLILISMFAFMFNTKDLMRVNVLSWKFVIIGLGLVLFSFVPRLALIPFISVAYIMFLIEKHYDLLVHLTIPIRKKP
ncbi:MAG: hypothetical protein GY909_15590 [Oligoflexia bacterium]|nr:hypothetical protein [Oligoflexia bacterium]